MPNQFLSGEGDLENYFITEYWLIDQYVGDTLWAWGINTNGQLGTNTVVNRSTPVTTFAGGTNWKQVSCGTNHTLAIKTDGTLWAWGQSTAGQIGVNDNTTRSTPVTTFAGGTNWKQVACGASHSLAIKTDGTLWGWGSGVGLGIGAVANKLTPVTTTLGGTDWKQVACGDNHSAVIKTDGTLWVWGSNTSGQLGINDATQRLTPVTTFAGGSNWKQVGCGYRQIAAIKTDGTLWTWGINSSGQLGLNDIILRSTPVTTFAGGSNWKQIGVTFSNSPIAIKTDGTLWIWGQNTSAQLGNNTVVNRSTPVTTFAGGTNWKQVAAGQLNTAAIKTDGTLWIWGGNGSGQLGNNTTVTRSTPVTTFAGGTNWKQVTGGSTHTVAVTSGSDPTFFIS